MTRLRLVSSGSPDEASTVRGLLRRPPSSESGSCTEDPRWTARRRQPLVRVLSRQEVPEPPSNVLTSEQILGLVGPDVPYDHTVHGL